MTCMKAHCIINTLLFVYFFHILFIRGSYYIATALFDLSTGVTPILTDLGTDIGSVRLP